MVTVVQEPLREPILDLMEVSTGESDGLCAARNRGAGLRADSCDPGDIFAGRRICFPCTPPENGADLEVQQLGDHCRRLLSSHGVNVQISMCGDMWRFSDNKCAMVKSLAPHLCRMVYSAPRLSPGIRLQTLLPAAAQLEQVMHIDMDPNDVSLLGQFHMLKELHVTLRHPVQLTAPLPQLHTLRLMFHGTVLREVNLQCLFTHAPALRQLVVDCGEERATNRNSLNIWDMEALVRLQCLQLDLLTIHTIAIDEHSVTLLARIQCPLKLSIGIRRWGCCRLGKGAPLLTLLAGLPNLVELELFSFPHGSYVLWDQRGAILPYVRRLAVNFWPASDLQLLTQSILSMCPALTHLSLHSHTYISLAARLEVHAQLWPAFKICAKLVSLTVN